jgi:hypothetical protein
MHRAQRDWRQDVLVNSYDRKAMEPEASRIGERGSKNG